MTRAVAKLLEFPKGCIGREGALQRHKGNCTHAGVAAGASAACRYVVVNVYCAAETHIRLMWWNSKFASLFAKRLCVRVGKWMPPPSLMSGSLYQLLGKPEGSGWGKRGQDTGGDRFVAYVISDEKWWDLPWTFFGLTLNAFKVSTLMYTNRFLHIFKIF